MEMGKIVKMTLKSRILLALDKFLRGFYPLWLNHWIFDHLDREEEKEMK